MRREMQGREYDVEVRGELVYDPYPESCLCILAAVDGLEWSSLLWRLLLEEGFLLLLPSELVLGGEGGSQSSISLLKL